MGWMVAAGGVGSIVGSEGDWRMSEEGTDKVVDGTNRCSVEFADACTGSLAHQGTNFSALRLLTGNRNNS